jgi:hypothetical protein
MKRSNDSPSPHLPLGPPSCLARVFSRGGIGRILSTSQSSINLVATFSRRNRTGIRFSANKLRLFAIDNRNHLTVWRPLEYSSSQRTRKESLCTNFTDEYWREHDARAAHPLADSFTKLKVAELMMLTAACLFDRGKPCGGEAIRCNFCESLDRFNAFLATRE